VSANREQGTGNRERLAEARTLLGGADQVLVMTGAGISAESGVPTFRGPGGLWKQFRPEDLATQAAFQRDPRLVWEWYGWRREKLATCAPNPGHLALARWMAGRNGITLVTQNVDGLHEAAARQVSGDYAQPPIRLHGSITRVRCSHCDHATEDPTPINSETVATLPRCPRCRSLLRPDVVWFGEALPASALEAAARAAEAADVCLVIGTAGAVYPAAGYVFAVQRRGNPVIVVDPGETAFDSIAAVKLTGSAGDVLPGLLDRSFPVPGSPFE
jgi:NAD-dependent deacetylase